MHEEASVLLDRHLRRLARMRDPVELRIALLLHRMQHLSTYLDLGFARMTDYAIERLGLRPRRTHTLISMGRKLDRLPETSRAVDGGPRRRPLDRGDHSVTLFLRPTRRTAGRLGPV